ncbi:MAG TPA: phospholipase D-like domain-containing protein [Candidatus Norongarragalinales archaeon]|nr:phospholipase D-like domain-containing protein [Candidatus Norongarragalinales archaeon]
MKPHVVASILMLLAGLLIGYNAPQPKYDLNPQFAQPGCSVSAESIISPGAGDKMVSIIDSARSSIHIILFEFSYPDLKEALVHAAQRGVEVRLILDPKVDQNLDTADFLKSRGIKIRWSSPKFNYSHAKTAIIDGRKVLTGSLNWSRNAMVRNREIGVLVEAEGVALELEAIFEQDWVNGGEVK